MALGGLTLTIKVNSVDKVLKRVNQDDFKTEYRLYETTGSYRAFVRHSIERSKGAVYDRHNVEITYTLNATETLPARTRRVYYSIVNSSDDTFVDVGHLAIALADLVKVSGNVDDLLTWVS